MVFCNIKALWLSVILQISVILQFSVIAWTEVDRQDKNNMPPIIRSKGIIIISTFDVSGTLLH